MKRLSRIIPLMVAGTKQQNQMSSLDLLLMYVSLSALEAREKTPYVPGT